MKSRIPSARRLRGAAVVVALVAASLGSVVLPAQAVQTAQSVVVNANPADFTPHVLDGSVKAIAQAGNTIILGGVFTQVRSSSSPTVITRSNLVAFDATTGAISTTFAPTTNAEVTSLVAAPDGQSVYVSGFFSTVNGATRRYVTRLNLSDGALTPGFTAPTISARVRDMRLVGDRLYIAGGFATVAGQPRAGLAALNAATGAFVPEVDVPFAGNQTGDASVTQVMKMDVTPDGTRLVAIGNFNSVLGQTRNQIVMLQNLSGAPTLADWNTTRYAAQCASVFDTYMRDLDISPDGSYFVVSTTGAYRGPSPSMCDTTARWETGATGATIQPTWVDTTGGDTTYAVAVTGTAVYVGGHFRWQNNPFAGDSAGAGSIEREGIAALDPVNGVPLSWNPGRTKGVGVFDFLATAQGLWVGSDTDRIGNFEYHGRIALMPVAGGTAIPAVTTRSLPGNVYLSGNTPATNPNILHRINAGGPTLGATDDGPAWSGDQGGANPLRNSGSNTAGWSAVPTIGAGVPASTPRAIFDSERWDPGAAPEMSWDLPVATGTQVQLRLYFASRCGCTSVPGSRAFDVAVDGTLRLDDYDIVADVGQNVGTVKTYDLTSDGTIDIDFTHVVENPLVNGLEVVIAGPPPPPPATVDDLLRRSYDGTTAGATGVLPDTGIAWGGARGAVMLNDTLFTPWADGNVYARSFDGTTFGPAETLDLLGLNQLAAEASSMSGAFYSNGRIYYALTGQAGLFYRYFTPESRVFGAERYTAASSVNLADASGMFLSGTDLYIGRAADGNLLRVQFTGGAVTGSATVVSGPGIDGTDWKARSMFVYGEPTEPPGNQSPTAAFTSNCSQLACTFDGGGSGDADGTIASYAWDFGDGTTATGPTPSHTYGAGGTFTVALTVTDNQGAQATATQAVTVAANQVDVGFRGVAGFNGNVLSAPVTVPAGVQAGDGMVLVLTRNSTATTVTPPAGWVEVDTQSTRGAASSLYRRVAAAGDAGQQVTFGLSAITKVDLRLVAYSGTNATNPIAAVGKASDAVAVVSHPSPAVPVVAGGSWAVTFWSDKSSTTTAWTAPTGVTTRATAIGSGGGRVTALVVDSGAAVPTGSYGELSAETDVASRAMVWTVVLARG